MTFLRNWICRQYLASGNKASVRMCYAFDYLKIDIVMSYDRTNWKAFFALDYGIKIVHDKEHLSSRKFLSNWTVDIITVPT